MPFEGSVWVGQRSRSHELHKLSLDKLLVYPACYHHFPLSQQHFQKSLSKKKIILYVDS